MNVGCNFLREHVIPEARIHYAITNAGGNAANVVQETAAVYYEARRPGFVSLMKYLKGSAKWHVERLS